VTLYWYARDNAFQKPTLYATNNCEAPTPANEVKLDKLGTKKQWAGSDKRFQQIPSGFRWPWTATNGGKNPLTGGSQKRKAPLGPTFCGYYNNILLREDLRTLYAVGGFTRVTGGLQGSSPGSGAAGENVNQNYVRNSFVAIDLAAAESRPQLLASSSTNYVSGNIGMLSEVKQTIAPTWIPWQNVSTTVGHLDSRMRVVGNKTYYRGFNQRVYSVRVFKAGNIEYLCLGGAFTGTGSFDLNPQTNGLVIFNLTNLNDAPKEFSAKKYRDWLDGNGLACTVSFSREMKEAPNHLYICGCFDFIKPSGATTSDYLVCPGAARINMFNLQGPKDTWLDTKFIENIRESFRIRPDNAIKGQPWASFSSYSRMQYPGGMVAYKNYLYLYGCHKVYDGKLKLISECISVHDLETGKINKNFKCYFNTGVWPYQPFKHWWNISGQPLVSKLVVEDIYDKDDASKGTKPSYTVMYCGGMFNAINMDQYSFNPKAPTYQTRNGAAAFLLENSEVNYANSPKLLPWYIPGCDGGVNNFIPGGKYSDDPLYITGNFRNLGGYGKIAATPRMGAAAITKPAPESSIGFQARILPWDIKCDYCPIGMVIVPKNSPMNQTIPEADRKESMLVWGRFTKVLGKQRYGLARVSTIGNEVQRNQEAPPVVVWKVAGKSFNNGDAPDIPIDNIMTLAVTAAECN
jgi:hypothetical protein